MKGVSSATLAIGAGLVSLASALTPVTIKGNAFFSGSDRFYIRGVDYQPGGSSKLVDPLADQSSCTRDIKKFKDLGVNTIRIYTVDNSKNHDTCMKALADAGIYLILDVNSPKWSLNRNTPLPSYNTVYLQNIFATMEMFSKYDNTLAFFSGNEVVFEALNSTEAAPYVKAVTRDMKAYLKARKLRQVPVGYSAADVSSNRLETAQYLNCGADSERSDFFAFNDYSWCDPSSFQKSGWDQKVKNFTDYSIPIFLSEHGCNTNTRTFGDVKSLYSSDMTSVYSGGLVYEYSQEESNYGLVEINGNTVKERPDYQALKKAYAGTPNASGDGGYRQNLPASKCPAANSNWAVKNNLLPIMPAGAKKFMDNGAGAGPGLNGNGGDGSQWGDDPSPGFATSETTGDSGSSGSSAAAPLRIPDASIASLVCGLVVLLSSFMGTSLL